MQPSFSLLLILLSHRCSTFAQTTGSTEASRPCSHCHHNASCEENHRCVCKDGFSGDGVSCSDVDECSKRELNRCHLLAKCVNHPGNYSCSCPEGYDGDGFHCEIIRLAEERLQVKGALASTDPCLSHTVLDDPWRSTSYGKGTNCDSNKFGWFRFEGKGGERMPETCPPVHRCNTEATMWINGLHPTTSDETVNRTACAHWQDNCCRWLSRVTIKACLGGFYVYMLYGTPSCSLSYCTDPKYSGNPCPQCAEEEECRLVNGKWGCYCRQEYNSTDISRLQPQLECGGYKIKISLEKCLLEKMGLRNVNVYLKDEHCPGFDEQRNEKLVSVVTPTHGDQCGTELTRNRTHATYSNTLHLTNGDLLRDNEIKINFHCSYPLNMETSLETAVHPMASSVNMTIRGAGTFEVKMAVYRDSNYTSPYEGSMAVLSSQDRLHVGVMVTRGDMWQFVLRMENCYATPTSKASDPVKYAIIYNGCPSQADPTTEVLINGDSEQGRFSLQIFKLIKKLQLVYLHCEVQLCDKRIQRCEPHCSKPGSYRAAAVQSDHLLHVGPIIREDVLTGAATSHGFQRAWMTLLILAVLGFSLHAFP